MSQGLSAGVQRPAADAGPRTIHQTPNETLSAGGAEAAALIQKRLSHIPSSCAARRLGEYVALVSDSTPSANRLAQLEQVITKHGDKRLSTLFDEFQGHIARLSKACERADSRERQAEINKILRRVTDITELFDGKKPEERRVSSIERRVHQVALAAQEAGFTGERLVQAIAIALAESSGDPKSRNGSCKGLFQIHTRWHADMCSGKNVYDPVTNARFAYEISGGGKNWHPWGVYPVKYKKFLPDARRAVAHLGDAG